MAMNFLLCGNIVTLKLDLNGILHPFYITTFTFWCVGMGGGGGIHLLTKDLFAF